MGYLRSHWWDAAGALVSLLVVSAATLATPQLVRIAVDRGITGGSERIVWLSVLGLVAVAAARGVFSFVQGYLAERASQSVAYDMRNALFEHIGKLSFSFYDRQQTGQLLTRITSDVEQIRGFVGTGIVQLIAAAAMLVGTLVLLIILNGRLAVVTVVVILPVVVLLGRFVRAIAPLFKQVQQALGKTNAILQQDLTGVRTIRAFGREESELARYGAANAELLDRNIATIHAISNNFPFIFLFSNLGTFAVIWVGGRQVIGGTLTLGGLLAFNSYLAFLVQPLLTIGILASSISRAAASSERVFELLDAPLEVANRPGATPLAPIERGVEFDRVCFHYPGADQDVLHDVSFSIPAGHTVALLGATGSGKSTVVNLIPRFYDVTDGAIRIDGRDIRDVQLESLRQHIGVVLQEVRLFAGSIRENIAYGRPDASHAEVSRAAAAAQADDFIRDLPEGYDTVIGERGVTLSGGQRQRIAIARALLVDPRLLILDDSTSALDAATDAALRAALDRLMRDRRHTVVVIAQRVSTVRDADSIVILENGRIAAQGTHEVLLKDSPLYNAILGSQLEPASDAVTEGAA